ncbi:MAG: hypothetical protein C0423_19810 [Methylibium sp.]|nr:hypothetical protein [Methylibium sp.]
MSESRRETVLDAIKASLAAMCPGRHVERGLQDPAQLGDTLLARGVMAIVAQETEKWLNYPQREAESGTLRFSVIFHCLPSPNASTLDVERAEGEAEEQLLAWCRSVRPEPIDTVFPRRATYSRGLDAPLAWLVMEMEAAYV